MTIANILRLNGIDVERSVSPTGRIIFPSERETTTAPLKPHTFHGGEEPPDADEASQWWLVDSALERDKEAMQKYFPSFRLIEGSNSRPPAWIGTIDTGRGKFQVAIQHRTDGGLPAVVPLAPRRFTRADSFRRRYHAPHLYLSGNLCVASQDDWDPAHDTAATVTAWAAHWYSVYVEWLFTGVWVTEGYRGAA